MAITAGGFDPDLSDQTFVWSGSNISYIEGYSGSNVYRQTFTWDGNGLLQKMTAWTLVPGVERTPDGSVVARSTGTDGDTSTPDGTETGASS